MMRWLAPPLVAAVALTGSGFLSSLERASDASVLLARATERAPESTAAAARELGPLPDAARLTGRQAELAEALADALRLSADRLGDVNEALEAQVGNLEALRRTIEGLEPRLSCIRDRTEELVEAAGRPPEQLATVTGNLRGVLGWQEKSIRHLRSINRKLAALGVVAIAAGVQPPAPPGPAPAPEVEEEAGGVPC